MLPIFASWRNALQCTLIDALEFIGTEEERKERKRLRKCLQRHLIDTRPYLPSQTSENVSYNRPIRCEDTMRKKIDTMNDDRICYLKLQDNLVERLTNGLKSGQIKAYGQEPSSSISQGRVLIAPVWMENARFDFARNRIVSGDKIIESVIVDLTPLGEDSNKSKRKEKILEIETLIPLYKQHVEEMIKKGTFTTEKDDIKALEHRTGCLVDRNDVRFLRRKFGAPIKRGRGRPREN